VIPAPSMTRIRGGRSKSRAIFFGVKRAVKAYAGIWADVWQGFADGTLRTWRLLPRLLWLLALLAACVFVVVWGIHTERDFTIVGWSVNSAIVAFLMLPTALCELSARRRLDMMTPFAKVSAGTLLLRKPSWPKQDEIPTYPGVTYGWRAWKLVYDQNGWFRLSSLFVPTAWPHRERLEAFCQASGAETDHSAPARECDCGVWATRTDAVIRCLFDSFLLERGELIVYGKVALWGRVLEYERGFRAQYAYPSELYAPRVALLEGGRMVFVPSNATEESQRLLEIHGIEGWAVPKLAEAYGVSVKEIPDRRIYEAYEWT
jgi:hypothetical protein